MYRLNSIEPVAVETTSWSGLTGEHLSVELLENLDIVRVEG